MWTTERRSQLNAHIPISFKVPGSVISSIPLELKHESFTHSIPCGSRRYFNYLHHPKVLFSSLVRVEGRTTLSSPLNSNTSPELSSPSCTNPSFSTARFRFSHHLNAPESILFRLWGVTSSSIPLPLKHLCPILSNWLPSRKVTRLSLSHF